MWGLKYSCFAKWRRGRKRLDTFYARLKQLPKNCCFYHVDREINPQIIQKCQLSKVREKGMGEPNITLVELIKYGRTLDAGSSVIKLTTKTNPAGCITLGMITHDHT